MRTSATLSTPGATSSVTSLLLVRLPCEHQLHFDAAHGEIIVFVEMGDATSYGSLFLRDVFRASHFYHKVDLSRSLKGSPGFQTGNLERASVALG